VSSDSSILVADDEPVFRGTLCELLALRGYRCESAADAGEAQQKLRQEPFDLLIADIKMPGNDDLELIRHVHQAAADLPVILVTAHPSVRTAVEAYRLPVVDYLLKPVDFDDLVSRVRAALSLRKARRGVAAARAKFDRWFEELQNASSSHEPAEGMAVASVDAFVAMNLQSIAGILTQFSHLMHDLTTDLSDQEQWKYLTFAQVDAAYRAIRETITALKETKQYVKSRRLAQLRHKLQVLIDEWPTEIGHQG
jgi:DNA-binding response OmpR family regulator